MGIFAFWTHSFCGCYVQDLPGVTSQTQWGRNILFQMPQEAPIHYEEDSSDGETISEFTGAVEDKPKRDSSDGESVIGNEVDADSSDGETISELTGFPENPAGSANNENVSQNDADGEKLMQLSENYEPSSFAQD